MIKAGRDLLNKILQYFGFEPIQFNKDPIEFEEETKERPSDVEYLIRLILDDYRHVRIKVKECDYNDVVEDILCLAEKKILGSYYRKITTKDGEDALGLTSMITNEIAERYKYYVTSLKAIAEKIGAKYEPLKIEGKTIGAIIIPRSKLEELLK